MSFKNENHHIFMNFVAQIYDNTTRFGTNKFATFGLWKNNGYEPYITYTNGGGYFTQLGEEIG